MSFTPRGVVVFGMVRPCSHRLGENLKTQWMAHLCGLCLALRGDHGQFARVVTNYDGLLLSVLTEAQVERAGGGWRRTAGPCPLRGMRTASVAQGEGARLAAAVSLVLASAKVRDHVADGDGLLARRPVALAARRIAGSWGRAGARTGSAVGFDAAVLVDAVERQFGIESLAGLGTPILTVTEPTETATAAAFAHTAILAGRPGNAVPLAEAGRLFGRLAHLLDAVEDKETDAASGAWNPLTATGTPLTEARRLADDALHGIRLALREVAWGLGSPQKSTARTAGSRICCSRTNWGARWTGPSAPGRAGTDRRARSGRRGLRTCRAIRGTTAIPTAVSPRGPTGVVSGPGAPPPSGSAAPARRAAPTSSRGRGRGGGARDAAPVATARAATRANAANVVNVCRAATAEYAECRDLLTVTGRHRRCIHAT